MRLTKHHGLGNDFLVLIDLERAVSFDEGLARALCHRRRGVGADGLIRVVSSDANDGAPLRMELRNADGGRAEMSGNGIRCLAQAVVDAGLAPEGRLAVRTDAGVRQLVVEPETAPGLRFVSVDMGPALVQADLAQAAGVPTLAGPDLVPPAGCRWAAFVDMGNPHLVFGVRSLDGIDVARQGSAIDRESPQGMNVEFVVQGSDDDGLAMVVWERGAGVTEACGTGACAVAVAAHHQGLVGKQVRVHQPGGEAHVELLPHTVVLTGPTQYIATIEVPIA